MTTYPNINNEPELIKIKTRDDEIKNLKYQREQHDHENLLKSLKVDNEYYTKKYKNLNKMKVLLIITEILVGSGSAMGTSPMSLLNPSIGIVLTSSTALLTSIDILNITQDLTSVDIHEIVKIGGKVIEIYEGVIYRENFKNNPFEKVITKLFALRQKYNEENNDVMQLLVKLIMNASYGEFLKKDITESYQCKSEMWMQTEYDERVLDYQENNHGNSIVKMKDDEGLEDEVKKPTRYLYN